MMTVKVMVKISTIAMMMIPTQILILRGPLATMEMMKMTEMKMTKKPKVTLKRVQVNLVKLAKVRKFKSRTVKNELEMESPSNKLFRKMQGQRKEQDLTIKQLGAKAARMMEVRR